MSKINLATLVRERTKELICEGLTEQDFIETEEELTGTAINQILSALEGVYGLVAKDDNYFVVKDELHSHIMIALRKSAYAGFFQES